jgi:hypothetical protein
VWLTDEGSSTSHNPTGLCPLLFVWLTDVWSYRIIDISQSDRPVSLILSVANRCGIMCDHRLLTILQDCVTYCANRCGIIDISESYRPVPLTVCVANRCGIINISQSYRHVSLIVCVTNRCGIIDNSQSYRPVSLTVCVGVCALLCCFLLLRGPLCCVCVLLQYHYHQVDINFQFQQT